MKKQCVFCGKPSTISRLISGKLSIPICGFCGVGKPNAELVAQYEASKKPVCVVARPQED